MAELENTKFIVDVATCMEANAYLKLGWVLTGQYKINTGDFGGTDESMRYVLGWQKEGEIPHPEQSAYKRNEQWSSDLRTKGEASAI